ncbi:MAG TPA: hypothetical protein VKZ96_02685 [Thermomicrobiales bacterium]|nr:hypothetical protein [Thermomicrobiales bacterium]
MGVIRRADFWEVKPGKLQALIEMFYEFKAARMNYSDGPFRLLLISDGWAGPANLTADHCYSIADFPDGAAFGDYLKAFTADAEFQRLWAHLHSEETPAVHRGAGLLFKFHEEGERPESLLGGVTPVRAWKIAPGMETVTQAAGQLVQRHACRYGGYLQVLGPMFAPTSGPNVVTAISFPDWSAFGPFLDEFNEDPEIQQALAPFHSATPPAELVQEHIAMEIAE